MEVGMGWGWNRKLKFLVHKTADWFIDDIPRATINWKGEIGGIEGFLVFGDRGSKRGQATHLSQKWIAFSVLREASIKERMLHNAFVNAV